VRLTFDDGPSQWTAALLDVLAEHDVRATFFVLGEHALERPELVARAAAEGHELGNHTLTHPDLPELGDEEIREELERANAAIAAAAGVTPTIFRAPHLRVDERVLSFAAELGLHHVGCDVIPRDWETGTSAETIAERVQAETRDDSIVLLHDGRPRNSASARTDCSPTIDAVRLLLGAR
jgi:chitooligosaccharide deacetylase